MNDKLEPSRIGSIIELTDAQTSLTTANTQHLQALYNSQTAVAALEKATGRSVTNLD